MALPEALYRAAFDQSVKPIIVVDGLGVAAVWNGAFEALFRSLTGLGPEKLQGSFFDFLAEREGIRFDYYAAEILLGGRPSATVETRIRSADGTRRWLSFGLSLLEAPSLQAPVLGKVERYLLCAIDEITERVLREQRLQDAKDEAEKATHTKSQFLANMSHEIRTPIQTILGVVELLDETSLDTEQNDYVNQVRFSAEVLLGLINDILDFSKIEAGKLDLETTNFDLRACVHQSVDMLVMDAHRKGLEIIVDVEESLPTLLRGDPGRLRQIIVNLFKNAVKFTREGSISLSLRSVAKAQGPSIRFEVADTGPGVPEAVRDRLFTPFYQGDFAQARKAGGTGLGLAISRHLVELMGGSIGLKENVEPGDAGVPGTARPSGALFWFDVPLVVPEFSAPPRLSLQPPIADAGLLVVDDHPKARDFVARTARAAGYRVAEAGSGEEALELLHAAVAAGEAFAICLIDQNMPRMDGWRLASEITGDIAINSARLILMAPVGTIGADAKMKLLRWFNGYISKPVKPGELFEAMQKALTVEVDLESAEAGAAKEKRVVEDRFECDVLVAEDHEVNRELFTVILERLGCRVVTARDGLEAAEIGASRKFDIILMDIFMPRMNGYEATKALRDRGYAGPIVAVTASALRGEREKCLEAGMNDILVKPFKKKDLAAVLAIWVKAKEAATAETDISSARDEENEESLPDDAPSPAASSGDNSRPGPTEDLEVFDWEAVIDTFLGQRGTVVGLLERFIKKAGNQTEELAQALTAKDFTKFREIAHSIKGASWNLSAKRLGDAALAAESAGKAGDAAAAEKALALVLEANEEFNIAVKPRLSS